MKALFGRTGAILALTTLILAGCGGSSGGDGGVSPPPPPPPPPTGGITRTGVGVAVGPITGFGSVIVNGVRYETNAATEFTRDDNPSAQDAFKVGETVIVKGTIDDNNANAVAESVELDEIVKGPATSLVDLNTAIVMGQTVNSTATTSIDDNCGAVTFDDLTGLTGFFAVEVYGTVQASGAIDATRIECKQPGEVTEFEVNGIVSGNVPGSTFMINALQVNYSATPLIQNFPNGAPEDGQPVEVKGAPGDFSIGSAGQPDVLAASKVEFKGNRLDGNEGDHFEIEGFISAFRSISDFDVRVGSTTFTVATDPASTTFEGDQNLLDVNVKVEVEGDLDGDLNIFATKVEIKTSTNIRVTGVVDPIVNGEIRILNIRINTNDGETRFEDKRDDDPNFDAGSVMAGDFVEARGQEIPTGEITAFVFERDDLDPDTELRGFVEDGSVSGRNSFVILGVTVDTSNVQPDDYSDGNNNPITADAFWSAVGTGGVIVDAKGVEEADGTTLTARELELEME